MAEVISDVRQQASANLQQAQGQQGQQGQGQGRPQHRLQVVLPNDPAGSLRPSAAPSPLPDPPLSPRSGASYWLGPAAAGHSALQQQPRSPRPQQQQPLSLGQQQQQQQQQLLQQDHPSGVWSDLDALALPAHGAAPHSEPGMELMDKQQLAAALAEAQRQVERLRGIVGSLTMDMEGLQVRQLEQVRQELEEEQQQRQQQQGHSEQWLNELSAVLRGVPEAHQGTAAAVTAAALLAGALRRLAGGRGAGAELDSSAAAADLAVLQAEVQASDADLAHALRHVEALQQQLAAAAGPQPGSGPAAGRPQPEAELLFLRGRLQQLMQGNRQLRRQCAQLQLALAGSGLHLAAGGASPAAAAAAALGEGQQQQQQQQQALARAQARAEGLHQENERLMDLSNSLRAERDRLQQQLAALAAAQGLLAALPPPSPDGAYLPPGAAQQYCAWPAAPGAAYPAQGYYTSYAPAAGAGPGGQQQQQQQQQRWAQDHSSGSAWHSPQHYKRLQQQQQQLPCEPDTATSDASAGADQGDSPGSPPGRLERSYGSPGGSPAAGRWPSRSPRRSSSSSSAALAELRARQLAAAGAGPGSSPGRPAVVGTALLPATMSARETASQRERLRAMQRRRESAAAAAAEQQPRVRNYSIKSDDDPRASKAVLTMGQQ
jgi:hypothetical protein